MQTTLIVSCIKSQVSTLSEGLNDQKNVGVHMAVLIHLNK